MNHHNIAVNFEYVLCPSTQGYLNGAKPYELLRQWINRMYEHGYNIYIVSEQFSDMTSYDTEMRVKWLHENNINYNMLITSMALPLDYFYFIRRFESNELFLYEQTSGYVKKFTGVDFNLLQL